MRGSDRTTGSLFSYVDIDACIPAEHPLRLIRWIVNDVLVALDAELDRLYEPTGRDSIQPERLLRGSLLQMFSIRSAPNANWWSRWTTTCATAGSSGSASTIPSGTTRPTRRTATACSKPTSRGSSSRASWSIHRSSREHFTVDGTLVNAWAWRKSFVPKGDAQGYVPPAPPAGGEAPPKDARPHGDNEESTNTPKATDKKPPMQSTDTDTTSRNAEVDFHGQRRSNATHASTADEQGHLYRKGRGKEARLAYMGHALAENRHGLIVGASLTQATGMAEREAAKEVSSTPMRPAPRVV